MNEQKLHAWGIGPDTVVASNKEDAIRVWEKHTGEIATDYDLVSQDVIKCNSGCDLRIHFEDVDFLPLIPLLSCWERVGRWGIIFDAPTSAWVEANGRGFLCSTEY